MSADNGVYILKTKDKFKHVGGGLTNSVANPITAYRVAYAQAIDNFEWYKKHEPHNLGFYLKEIWGNSKVHYDYEKALRAAEGMAQSYDYLEYGISDIDAEEYNFPGC